MFVRGGFIYPGGRLLNNAGNYGYYWSSVSGGSAYSYYLYVASGRIDSSEGYDRYAGFSIRCVALGG